MRSRAVGQHRYTPMRANANTLRPNATIYYQQQQQQPADVAYVNTTYSWWCVLLNALLFVWILVIAIIYFYGYADIKSDAKTLKEDLGPLEELILEEFVGCCENIIPSDQCACNGTGLLVLCWDANTNVPMLQSGVPPPQDILYVVCTPGSTFIDGNSDWEIGDYVRFSVQEGLWFQNKASGGAGLPSDSFSLQYYGLNGGGTTPLGVINCTVLTVDSIDGFYLIRCSGGDPIVSVGSEGYRRVVTDPLPAQFQVNTTVPIQNSYRINIPAFFESPEGSQDQLVSVDLTDILQFANGAEGSYFIGDNDMSNECVGGEYSWSDFYILYNTDPPVPEFDATFLAGEDGTTVWEWGERMSSTSLPACIVS